MAVTTLSTEFGGRTLTIETGRMALLAGGSVTVRYGDTVLLGTANRSDPRPGLDVLRRRENRFLLAVPVLRRSKGLRQRKRSKLSSQMDDERRSRGSS